MGGGGQTQGHVSNGEQATRVEVTSLRSVSPGGGKSEYCRRRFGLILFSCIRVLCQGLWPMTALKREVYMYDCTVADRDRDSYYGGPQPPRGQTKEMT